MPSRHQPLRGRRMSKTGKNLEKLPQAAAKPCSSDKSHCAAALRAFPTPQRIIARKDFSRQTNQRVSWLHRPREP